ncbi:MAG: bifunctional phosphopantothenoylcysteine decarboxylase/phosphopantothenate--cysteine ligase CoaBC [Gammaproteobacteria bacterium]|nr:bifunctional phosphopantothenoylcysteine decarboxylase/phosphopantothenate--cysteine ligase CoaBC [Gammaproteobacteria bacterium]
MSALDGKNVLLGVTGGIAAYKSPALVRRLRERGARVRVVMTEASQRFIGAQTLQAVSGEAVRTSLWDEQAEASMGHIELARWADLVVIAPATADSMARMAHGYASDLLSTLCLATDAPIWIAPAMNRLMWANAATQANADLLQQRGIRRIGPGDGAQACGEVGSGRMTEPDEIVACLEAGIALPVMFAAGTKVLISAGPTRERIDPVRYISNHSSGKMGFAIARAARAAGAEVILVAGPVNLPTPDGVVRIDVESAAQMHRAVHDSVANSNVFIATAAVADHRPATPAAHKLKKSDGDYTLTLEQTTDILASVAALPDRPYCVGFAAETRDIENYAQAKLVRKGIDMIVANEVGERDGKSVGFGADDNELLVIWDRGRHHLPRSDKQSLACELVQLIAARLDDSDNHKGERRA